MKLRSWLSLAASRVTLTTSQRTDGWLLAAVSAAVIAHAIWTKSDAPTPGQPCGPAHTWKAEGLDPAVPADLSCEPTP